MSELIPEGEDRLRTVQALVASDPHMVVALTGQVVDLSDPISVAEAHSDVSAAIRQLEGLRETFANVLRLESLRQATKTLHLSDTLTVVVSGGEEHTYADADGLEATLRAAGMSEGRLAQLIVRRPTVNGKVAREVAAASPTYAAAIAAHRKSKPAPWRAKIERKGLS